MSTASTLNSTTLPLSDSTHDRVTWRLMPLLLVCYVSPIWTASTSVSPNCR